MAKARARTVLIAPIITVEEERERKNREQTKGICSMQTSRRTVEDVASQPGEYCIVYIENLMS